MDGHAGVRALALDHDREFVAGGHDGAGRQAELAGLHAGPVVHAEHRFHWETLEQAVVDHALGAATAFFGGLEDHVHDAREIAVLRQVLRRGQQHGGVAVMATAVHLAVVARPVVELVFFLHGQGVHVGAQPQPARTRPAAQGADHAGHAQAAVHLVAPGGQAFGHEVAGGDFLVGQFGMRMDLMAQRHHLFLNGLDFRQHGAKRESVHVVGHP
ncbi:hypothetical protein G6F57_018139 [Rhizopus arrhizus]|nr:hypothetical protein G6F57_018139 [Rhizopus arrhizus]